MKYLEAICATSLNVGREQIAFDESTGLIEKAGDLGLSREELDFYFDDNCLLFAGMGDVHIHAREDVSGKNNYKEDFLTARSAMLNGGVSHAGDMPNNPVPPIDNPSYEAKARLCEKACGDIWIYAGIGPDTRPLSYPVPYKVYMGPSVGELFFKDLESLDKVLENYQGQWVSFHCEDPEVLEAHKSESAHHIRRPARAEVVATRDALKLIEKYKLKGKLCHYSTHEGLDLIREARKKGVDVSIEVTPQHLYFDVEHLNAKERGFFQMNPPIRSESDKNALLEALKNGEIQYLATDHAPHTQEEKERGTSGLTGLDSYGPFVTWLLDKGLDPKLIAKVTAENPGDFYNHFLPSWKKISDPFKKFGNGVGYLSPGFRANFTILNTKSTITIEKKNLKTKVLHSPFEGVTFPGRVEAMFIGGQRI